MLAGKPGEHILHRKTERGHLFERDVVLRLITTIGVILLG
jgi:hypothetical protein